MTIDRRQLLSMGRHLPIAGLSLDFAFKVYTKAMNRVTSRPPILIVTFDTIIRRLLLR